jgi:AMP deaminase
LTRYSCFLGQDDVFENGATKANKPKPLFETVSLRQYYTDLDFVLNVCSDGPAKSFAFRRLKYLASKWNLYCLLNEYQEIADMKVRGDVCCDVK